MGDLFVRPDMPTQVGFYYCWHGDPSCDFNRYRLVVVKVIQMDDTICAVGNFSRPVDGNDVFTWGDRIPIPDPPKQLLQKSTDKHYWYNNVTKFKHAKWMGEFYFYADDVPVGSNQLGLTSEEVDMRKQEYLANG